MKKNNMTLLIAFFCLQTVAIVCSEQKNWLCCFKKNPYKGVCNQECNPRLATSGISGVITGITGLLCCISFTSNMTSNKYSCAGAFCDSCFPTNCSRTSDCCYSVMTWSNTLTLLTSLAVTACAWNPCCDDKGCNVSCKQKSPLEHNEIEMDENN